MYIGVVLDYIKEIERGILVLIGSIPNCKSNFEHIFCQFSLSECHCVIHQWKLILIKGLEKIEPVDLCSKVILAEKCTHNALDITDNYNNLRKEYFCFNNSKIWKDLIDRIPYYHPSLFRFFIDNNFINEKTNVFNSIVDDRPGVMVNNIKSTEKLISELQKFSIEEVANSYEVSIKEYEQSRPGKDDKAIISIVGRRTLWAIDYYTNDPYIDEVLPNFNKTIARNIGWTPARTLLQNLWISVGGDKKKEELIIECERIKNNKIESFKKSYSKDRHLKILKEFAIKVERNLRLKIEYASRNKTLY